MRKILFISAALRLALLFADPGLSQAQSGANTPPPVAQVKANSWKFAVSGDSRNCGDVVMPAIAAGVKRRSAQFYWHLGDLRRISDIDEDIQHQPEHLARPLSVSEYEEIAWPDFIQSQIVPFGKIPFYLGIGNHETIPPKTRAAFIAQFSQWLDEPVLRAQRLRDDPSARRPTTYYHWIERGVDFIYLDNASADQLDPEQIAWFEKTLHSASANPKIRTIVAGMHEALPESISKDHSMQESTTGIESGRRVYADLLEAQNKAHKRVYVLASHSHYFMEGIFNTDYWRAHGGILPGWIIGTAGAQRYALPKEAVDARAAETNVYGFLLATVSPDGRIEFAMQRFKERDIPADVTARYTPEFVHWCFAENSLAH